MMVGPSVLWVRTRADVWVSVVCEASVGCKQQQLTRRAPSHEDQALSQRGNEARLKARDEHKATFSGDEHKATVSLSFSQGKS